MLAIERRNKIIEKLQAEKKVVVSRLSREYQVSEETIRRDLEKLEKEGVVTKSYGGAVLNESSNIDLPFNIRKNRNVIGKKKVASLVADLIQDGDRIIMDASSTAVFIAKKIKNKKNITLITNSIEILIEMADVQGWHIISTGGKVRSKTFALVGPQTDKMLSEYRVDKAIISCKGMDMMMGLSDSDEQHARNKYTMLQAASQKILAVDSTKFDETAFTKIADFSDVDIVITDEKPDGKWSQLFESLNIKCIYPEEE